MALLNQILAEFLVLHAESLVAVAHENHIARRNSLADADHLLYFATRVKDYFRLLHRDSALLKSLAQTLVDICRSNVQRRAVDDFDAAAMIEKVNHLTALARRDYETATYRVEQIRGSTVQPVQAVLRALEAGEPLGPLLKNLAFEPQLTSHRAKGIFATYLMVTESYGRCGLNREYKVDPLRDIFATLGSWQVFWQPGYENFHLNAWMRGNFSRPQQLEAGNLLRKFLRPELTLQNEEKARGEVKLKTYEAQMSHRVVMRFRQRASKLVNRQRKSFMKKAKKDKDDRDVDRKKIERKKAKKEDCEDESAEVDVSSAGVDGLRLFDE